MKTYINKVFTLVVLGLLCFACSPTIDEDILITTDQTGVTFIVNSLDDTEAEFIIGQNALISSMFSLYNQYVSLNFQLKTERDLAEIEKIDIYVSAQEESGYNYDSFDGVKKLFTTILSDNISSSGGNVVVQFDAVQLGELFKDEFTNQTKGDKSRTSENPLLESDLFTLTWVISYTDGTSFDSSEKVAPNNSHSIKTSQIQLAPPIWDGDFDYEVIDAASLLNNTSTLCFVGATGKLKIKEVGVGEYNFEETGAAGFFNKYALTTSYSDAMLTYDYDSGLSDVSKKKSNPNVTSYNNWKIKYIDARTIEITFYLAHEKYGEKYYATATVTRPSDNIYDWPSNLSGDIY